MNVTELLGASKAVGVAKPTAQGLKSDPAEDGEAFQSSMDSLTDDTQRSGGTSVQQPESGQSKQPSDPDQATDTTDGAAKASSKASGATQDASSSNEARPGSMEAAKVQGIVASVNSNAPSQSATNSGAASAIARAGQPALPLQTTGQSSNIVGTETAKPALPDGAISKLGGDLATQGPDDGSEKPAPKATLIGKQSGNLATGQEQTTLTQASALQAKGVEKAPAIPVAPPTANAQARSESLQAQNTSVADQSSSLKVEPRSQPGPEQDLANENQDADLRRNDRRDLAAAVDQKADIKRADNTVPTIQTNAMDAKVQMRGTSAVTTLSDVSPTTSTTQAAASTASATVREGSIDRALALNMPPAATDATARNIISQIAAAVRNKPLIQTVELSLDPPELGRIAIQMEVAEIGLKATLSAERSGTGDLIRRQAELLQQQLNEAGFSDVNLEFRDFGSGKQGDGEPADQASSNGRAELTDTPAHATPATRTQKHASISGMDVRL